MASDPPGLHLLEHLNLDVLDQEVAEAFYCGVLGCSKDPKRPKHRTLHSNCGYLTQFHTGKEEKAQIWRGVIELAFTPEALQKVVERVASLERKAEKNPFTVVSRASSSLRLRGPFGNDFLLRAATKPQFTYLSDAKHGIRACSEGSAPLGISSVTVACAPGKAREIAKFYLEVFHFPIEFAQANGEKKSTVVAGNGAQQIFFLETEGVAVDEDRGEHMAIYIGDFEGCFKRCKNLGLVWVNPRFKHLDNTETLEDARSSQTFRIRDVKGWDTGEHLLRLEHEIRSLKHPLCPLTVSRTSKL
mmetsp:Transcript_25824/g.45859  ORF Transcript_25824/g.45859 Transcript_25824/m.45859 type:complete len:302 (-) Transcript_25824:151-1056(-)|eukprot:CAMPEP_0197525280 /NCGR_PEP_ID=MMETSP1318-20131121/10731_1 /TAXON_ID=552666 /ORGANISM="Partenskyella glossopodia, Strain RCC365" /LENGTH=301 /DNA_ID=CAMNT_0043078485 /DNA_START=9 /DNA_END=914 /DNA_ORIENTATION=+